MMRQAVIIIILLLGGIAGVGAQEERLSVQAGINIFGDPAVGPKVYVEFPFSLDRSQFSFISYDSAVAELRASIFAEIIIMDTLGRHLDSTSTYFYTGAHSAMESRQANIRIFNKLSVKIMPGVYSAMLTVMDVVNKKEGTFSYDRLEIPGVKNDRLSLSMIELAYNIRSADELPSPNNRLVKSGREVIPNPMGICGADDSALFIYAETYNLNYNEAVPGKYAVSFKALDPQGFLKFDFGRFERDITSRSDVISARLDIKNWSPGKYDLTLIVEDLTNNAADTTRRRFIIFPRQELPSEFVQYSMRSPLDSASIETKSQLIKYLATPEQMTMYSALNDTGKSRFVDEFFRDHDPTPGTKENEYMNNAFSRYAFALQNFGTLPGARDGWKTDRGRVLMQYGQWDKRDEVPAPVYGQRYEVWYYYSQQGGIYFVFSDVKGYGEYQLVHSNASGEVYDNDWEYRLKDQGQEIYQGGSQFIE